MATTRSSNAGDLFLALGHPIRRLILRETIRRGREFSPSELADRLDQPLSKISYHVRILASCGAIEMARTRQIRGSTEHFYRTSLKARWARTALRQTTDPPGGGES